MKRALQGLVLVVGLGLMVPNVMAQGPPPSCPGGDANLIAKFEYNSTTGDYDFEKPGGNESVVSIDGNSTATEGSWTSTAPIQTLVIFGGTDSEYLAADPSGDASYSGVFDNTEITNSSGNLADISNIQFCKSPACEAATFSENVDGNSRTVTLTINSSDGIEQVNFSTLNNFDVSFSSSNEGTYSDLGGNDVWTTSGALSTQVVFTLTAPQAGKASYFAEVTSDCQGGFVTFLDPPHEFSKIAADHFALDGNYPNPFRDQTMIRFTLSEASDVTVSVYDVMGRQVATPVNQSLTAGSHEMQWNGRSSSGQPLSSGVYFYRIEAGEYSQTRRMTIVR